MGEICHVGIELVDVDSNCSQVHHGGAGTTAAGLRAAVYDYIMNVLNFLLLELHL